MGAVSSTNSGAWSPTMSQIMESMVCSACQTIPMLPVYVCESKGHPYCYWCNKILPRCTKRIKVTGGSDEEIICGSPIHPHRCELVEMVFLKSEFPCNNAAKGCKALVKGEQFTQHQDTCIYKTYICPFQVKCPEEIFHADFIPHLHFVHGISIIVPNPSGYLQMKMNCPTNGTEGESVVWVERIVEIHQICNKRTIYLFMNCKYVYGESHLIIWFTPFEDTGDVKLKLTFAIISDNEEVLYKINGMVLPSFCNNSGIPTNANHLLTIPTVPQFLGGRENNLDFWNISLKFYLVSVHCKL